jgi:peptidoglycan-N-acetylglucosamine deacetylase
VEPAAARRRHATRARRCLGSGGCAAAPLPPPHGVFTLTGLRLIRSLGLEPLLWSKWGRDWERRATAATITQHATTSVRAGDVVLLHDADHYGTPGNWRATAAAVPQIADQIAAAGLQTASVRTGAAPDGLTLTR